MNWQRVILFRDKLVSLRERPSTLLKKKTIYKILLYTTSNPKKKIIDIPVVSLSHNSTVHVELKLQTFIAHSSCLLPVVPGQELDKAVWMSSSVQPRQKTFRSFTRGLHRRSLHGTRSHADLAAVNDHPMQVVQK